jgi:hypothetical protein
LGILLQLGAKAGLRNFWEGIAKGGFSRIGVDAGALKDRFCGRALEFSKQDGYSVKIYDFLCQSENFRMVKRLGATHILVLSGFPNMRQDPWLPYPKALNGDFKAFASIQETVSENNRGIG